MEKDTKHIVASNLTIAYCFTQGKDKGTSENIVYAIYNRFLSKLDGSGDEDIGN